FHTRARAPDAPRVARRRCAPYAGRHRPGETVTRLPAGVEDTAGAGVDDRMACGGARAAAFARRAPARAASQIPRIVVQSACRGSRTLNSRRVIIRAEQGGAE